MLATIELRIPRISSDFANVCIAIPSDFAVAKPTCKDAIHSTGLRIDRNVKALRVTSSRKGPPSLRERMAHAVTMSKEIPSPSFGPATSQARCAQHCFNGFIAVYTAVHFGWLKRDLLLPSSLWIVKGKQQIAPVSTYRRCLRGVLAGRAFVRSTTTESLG